MNFRDCKKYDRKKFQRLYRDYGGHEFLPKTFSTAKDFSVKFPGIIANILRHKQIPV